MKKITVKDLEKMECVDCLENTLYNKTKVHKNKEGKLFIYNTYADSFSGKWVDSIKEVTEQEYKETKISMQEFAKNII